MVHPMYQGGGFVSSPGLFSIFFLFSFWIGNYGTPNVSRWGFCVKSCCFFIFVFFLFSIWIGNYGTPNVSRMGFCVKSCFFFCFVFFLSG